MPPTIPSCVVDDDDVFDWDAACREIDSTCVSTAPSTSNPVEPPHKLSKKTTLDAKPPLPSNTHLKSVASRQSTLDKYMGKSTASLQLDYRTVGDIDEDKTESSEELSSVKIDAEAAKFWIYPVNIPLRDYQLAITRTALFSNTMVSLPTGLGKTLIAAVVMYNYFRWFPEGKIVFAAPSRPLVTQQIEACHNIVGIPQEWTVQMTGKTSPSERARLWKSKRVFFVTPQVLEKDLQSGTCMVKQLVCLVIDEAHRASGNYAYCGAVRELMAVPIQFRILALTATPGEKQQAIQHIIDNLQISTIEYRNEGDPDVSPYVHDRKIELVEVAMGQDAIEINDMLLEVIRPYVTKLSGTGVLPRRDYLTLSPMDFLASREKFREAPPADLPSVKHAEVEGYFGVLITLYHMRKLLLSHGIRPTYEMLEEKLQQGCFARYMSRNEVLSKAKILMQQNLSHGAPSPKLSKMLEVLIDHFKTKDPQNSRVIIFSHFRGSVRDIMEALKNIGDIVKATEFIGQSSGKTLKGQSQKIQQAVLQKFRAGGYNVIVATSIAEEGLDIMEVDLVLCFDANISPLRMIQRMGRTGRKREGRVVVLACEGSEVKGYLRKQAKGKAVKKLMRNGGMDSFTFHPSPRMIPHIFKPEVHLIELSIDQFIHGEKKVKDDYTIQTPHFKAKLTDAETELVANYFSSTNESTWRPSLIAFPNFQAFPSRVHKVMHSFRTGLLIDAMQCLQGSSFHSDIKVPFNEEEAKSPTGLQDETGQQHAICRKDLKASQDALKEFLAKEVSDCEPIPVEIPSPVVQHCLQKSRIQLKEVSDPGNCVPDQTTSSNERSKRNMLMSELCNDDAEQENEPGEADYVQSPASNVNLLFETESIDDSPKREILLADHPINDFRDTELSPRIANFIEIGFVPESPEDNAGMTNVIGRKRKMAFSDNDSPAKSNNKTLLDPLTPANMKVPHTDDSTCGDVPVSSVYEEIRIPVNNVVCSPREEAASAFPDIAEVKTPLANMASSGCSENWCLSSGGKTQSIQKKVKLKRLRKYGDLVKQKPTFRHEPSNRSEPNSVRDSAGPSSILRKIGKGKSKPVKDARVFIEEEAEVSLEVEVSDDEEDEATQSCDSFIDDRLHPTAATQTQVEASRPDMMAIYRRSLLSQSPMVTLPNGSTECSPDSVASKVQISECGSPSGAVSYSLEIPDSDSEPAVPCQIESGRSFSEAMQSTRNEVSSETENKLESRKRRLRFYQAESVAAVNLDKEFLSHSEAPGRETFLQQDEQVQNIEDVFDDDQFFETLDLAAVEEQAAKLVAERSKLLVPPKTNVPNGVLCSPSFDLGI